MGDTYITMMLSGLLSTFLLAALISPTTSKCPGGCLCQDTIVSCKDAKAIPRNIPPETTKLYVQRMVAPIRAFTFDRLPNLRVFDISSSSIFTIEKFAFKNVHNLSTINIHHSTIGVVESYAFSNISNIKSITMNTCAINLFKAYSFSNITDVGHIDFINVNLRRVASNAFHDIHQMNAISFENVYFVQVATNFISSSSDIQTFTFVGNTIKKLHCQNVTELVEVANVLIIHDNRFTCNCHISWLFSLKQQIGYLDPIDEVTFKATQLVGEVFESNLCIHAHEVDVITPMEDVNFEDLSCAEDFEQDQCNSDLTNYYTESDVTLYDNETMVLVANSTSETESTMLSTNSTSDNESTVLSTNSTIITDAASLTSSNVTNNTSVLLTALLPNITNTHHHVRHNKSKPRRPTIAPISEHIIEIHENFVTKYMSADGEPDIEEVSINKNNNSENEEDSINKNNNSENEEASIHKNNNTNNRTSEKKITNDTPLNPRRDLEPSHDNSAFKNIDGTGNYISDDSPESVESVEKSASSATAVVHMIRTLIVFISLYCIC